MNKAEVIKRSLEVTDNDGWIKLYVDMFGEEPEFSGEDWGAYDMEKVIDAIGNNRPIREKELPRDAKA